MPLDHFPKPNSDQPAVAKSPDGEEFQVVGRAGPLRLRSAPGVLAETRQDLLVVKEGPLFACSRPNGDILPGLVTGEGLYLEDTRFLSELRLTLGGKPVVLLSSSDDLAYAMAIDATNPNLSEGRSRKVPQQSLSIQRFRVVRDRLYERISIRNYGRTPIRTTLELALGADFADTFEVRGVAKRKTRGHLLAPKAVTGGLRFGYVGEDEVFRETVVLFDPPPARLDLGQGQRAVAFFDVELAPLQKMSWQVSVEPSVAGRQSPRQDLELAERAAFADEERWRRSGSLIRTDNEHFNGFVDAAVRDLKALRTTLAGGEIFAAGIPWYVAPFGRDSLITSYETLLWNPAPAADCLRVLARLQAQADDPWRDAEPGKILHELRQGELAGAHLVPHTPYYGSVDSTPLFLMLAGTYYRWTADLELMRELRPAFDAALGWIAHHGDRDGDGFVEYSKRSPAGLSNQGWKDSEDCIVHADGSLAQGPIALVEVQGYVYLAKHRLAGVYEALGDPATAGTLRREAAALREAFEEAFWMPEEGTYALALDGKKRQVKGITSNPAHCLYCGIVGDRRAQQVGERLMAPDMFSGWGIRTLSKESPAYNPMGYHLGSVWPHDNVIAAAGLKRYGMVEATERIATALFDAAVQARDTRLDELYCGFDRRRGLGPVAYPVACRPQAWAAAVPIMLVQSFLGISADAPSNVLTINKPSLPAWLDRVQLDNLRVGNSRLGLAFNRVQGHTAFALTSREGDILVTTNR
ncbi:MAG: amylo-alpha-1,6-glucosidase [Actinomycetota bacterium]